MSAALQTEEIPEFLPTDIFEYDARVLLNATPGARPETHVVVAVDVRDDVGQGYVTHARGDDDGRALLADAFNASDIAQRLGNHHIAHVLLVLPRDEAAELVAFDPDARNPSRGAFPR